MSTNPRKELSKLGQSVWYDQMQRSLVTDGLLQKMIDRDDLRGLTSNPTIFEKAIGSGAEYDETLTRLAREGKGRDEIYEAIVVEDIGLAADVFHSVYVRTKGLDGYVSLEVSPALALDTSGTIEEGLKLFRLLGRDNVMIKVPATPEGLPAIEELIYNGVNVNVTLIFSREVYAQVIESYLRGLERRVAEGKPVDRIASVASFFVSRIDSKVEAALDRKIEAAASDDERKRAENLRGQVAIANAKLAYQLFKEIFASERYIRLRDAGAVPQRPLWASTGTKNPAWSDVLYIDQLIGDLTVNTMPPATYDAFRDHGRVEPTLESNVDGAAAVLAELGALGISLDQITRELTDEGVKSFADSFFSLLDTIEIRMNAVRRGIEGREVFHFASLRPAVDETLVSLQNHRAIERIWSKDTSFWKSEEEHTKIIANALGWLRSPQLMKDHAGEISSFADEIRSEFDHVVLLGMGGSSLCAEVFRRSYGRREGWPELHVLDSTVPDALRALEAKIDLDRSLFIVASKSGTTTEPAMFHRYYYDRVRSSRGDRAGSQFIAITDPETQLHRDAERDGFRRIFVNPPDIGGRYSVLSYFGMVPAALAGIDINSLLDRALGVIRSCSGKVPVAENPAALLGAMIGTMANVGRDKMTILASEPIASIGLWIEQLLAESTGKEAKGVVPVAGERLMEANAYGGDRFFVRMVLHGHDEPELDVLERDLVAAGQPLARLNLRDLHDLGEVFFVWELATAVAGAVMQINPFDQPNVQESKDRTRELLDAYAATGALPDEPAVASEGNVEVSRLSGVETRGSVDEIIGALIASVGPRDYLAITQYIVETPEHDAAIARIRDTITEALGIATTSGYGPRFLHSTGQLHKGGPDTSVFLQITADSSEDVTIPDEPFTFGTLAAAQAIGDFQSLRSRDRRAISIHLSGDTVAGLEQIARAVEQGVAAGH